MKFFLISFLLVSTSSFVKAEDSRDPKEVLTNEEVARLSAFQGTVWGDINGKYCGEDIFLKDTTTLVLVTTSNPFGRDEKVNNGCLNIEEIALAKWDPEKKAFRVDSEYVERIGARAWKMTTYYYIVSSVRIYMERYATPKKGGKTELDGTVVYARGRSR